MNDLYVQEFVKQAMQSGVPQETIAALLNRANEISNRQVKTAATKNIDIVDSLIAEAAMQKTASSVSYVHGIMNEAITNGANVPQAIQFTKQALAETTKKLTFMEKVSSIVSDPNLRQYAEGFIEMAKQAGLSQDDAVTLLVDVVDREKRAAGEPDGDEMFKQPSDQTPAPDSDPAAGSPPVDGSSDDEEAQILQLLQSLPPEEQQQVIQHLLAAISGGQGGPGGPGGPPPADAAGAGGPPPGGPQGPA